MGEGEAERGREECRLGRVKRELDEKSGVAWPCRKGSRRSILISLYIRTPAAS